MNAILTIVFVNLLPVFILLRLLRLMRFLMFLTFLIIASVGRCFRMLTKPFRLFLPLFASVLAMILPYSWTFFLIVPILMRLAGLVCWFQSQFSMSKQQAAKRENLHKKKGAEPPFKIPAQLPT